MNQVDTEMVFWIIVHEQTGIIDLISLKSKDAAFSSPYFLRSQLVRGRRLLADLLKGENDD